MRARYGLDGSTIQTLEEIGDEFGFTRERVRQIEVRALHKLRQPYRNYRMRDYTMDKLLLKAGITRADAGSVAAAAAVIADAEAASRRAEVALQRTRRGLPPLEEQLMMGSEPEPLGVRSELQSRASVTGRVRDRMSASGNRLTGVPRSNPGVGSRLAYRAEHQARMSKSRSVGDDGGVGGAVVVRDGDIAASSLLEVEGTGRQKQVRQKKSWGGVESGSLEEHTLLETLERFDLLDDSQALEDQEKAEFADQGKDFSDDFVEDFADLTEDIESEMPPEDAEEDEVEMEATMPSETLARLRSEMKSRPMSLGGRMSTVNVSSLQLA